MKRTLFAVICALLCVSFVLSLASCANKDEGSSSPSGDGVRSEPGQKLPVSVGVNDPYEPGASQTPGADEGDPLGPGDHPVPGTTPDTDEDTGESPAQNDGEPVDTQPPAPPEPDTSDEDVPIDYSKAELQYERVTPAVDRSMITSASSDTLETHGDFAGSEETLAELEELLDGFDGDITLIAYSLDGSRSLCYNTGTVYQPQCTYKAAFIFSICQYMDAIGFDDSTEFTLLEHNRMSGSGTVQRAAAGTKFTVHDLVTLCLSISDNAAFSLLHDHFGGGLRNTYMSKIGANSLQTSLLYGNNIAPGEFIILWNEIYNYFLSGTYYSQLMKNACTGTTFAYAKPVNGLSYSHKSGDGFDLKERHDVELVWDSQPYILLIFSRANVADGSSPTIENAAKIVHERLY